MLLPSRFQIGEGVVVNFGLAGVIYGEVDGVAFENGIVSYDIKVFTFPDEPNNKDLFVLLKGIRSYYVEEPYDRFFTKDSMVGLKLCNN